MDNIPQSLNQSAQYVKGVGPKKITTLNKLGIHTVRDLLYYTPRRYEDRSHFTAINKVQPGTVETLRGSVLTLGVRYVRGRLSIFNLAVGDKTGIIYGTWFNQPYLKNAFKVGDDVILHGKIEKHGKMQITNPEYEIVKPDEDDAPIHMGRIVPIYALTSSLGQRYLRSVIKRTVDAHAVELVDFLLPEIRQKHQLPGLIESIQHIHFPPDDASLQHARRRLIYDEFFLLQLALGLKRKSIRENQPGIAFKLPGRLRDKFSASLPFALTADQQSVIREIEADLAIGKPMNRLLQGDVGSGKTVVCMWAAAIGVQNKYQVALMAPTEILAQQHFQTFCRFLEPLGVRVLCLTSSMKKAAKEASIERVKKAEVDIVIGTHALIQDEVAFKRLGLVIVDEQHKFGVMQRRRLQSKGLMPDVLVMSATPIPRTLAITLYGDLDVSTIKEMPPGRAAVKTFWISEKKRPGLYDFIRQQLRQKQQIYVVYPLVEESRAVDLKDATRMYEHFKEVFSEWRVGLVHGRLKDEEKKAIMTAFKAGKIHILVATTVIEVGIDVANASVMVIEHAERFGLSQLHQLRGRVGRGQQQAYCVLLSSAESDEAKKRLSAMMQTTDGFKIAEYDLLIRGPGEFFGTRQHGLPELKLGNIITDIELLKLARLDAFGLVEHAVQAAPLPPQLAVELQMRFPGNTDLVRSR